MRMTWHLLASVFLVAFALCLLALAPASDALNSQGPDGFVQAEQPDPPIAADSVAAIPAGCQLAPAEHHRLSASPGAEHATDSGKVTDNRNELAPGGASASVASTIA